MVDVSVRAELLCYRTTQSSVLAHHITGGSGCRDRRERRGRAARRRARRGREAAHGARARDAAARQPDDGRGGVPHAAPARAGGRAGPARIRDQPSSADRAGARGRARAGERGRSRERQSRSRPAAPSSAPALRGIDASPVLYGGELCDPELMRLARRALEADGIAVGLAHGRERRARRDRARARRVAAARAIASRSRTRASRPCSTCCPRSGSCRCRSRSTTPGRSPEAVARALRSGVQAFDHHHARAESVRLRARRAARARAPRAAARASGRARARGRPRRQRRRCAGAHALRAAASSAGRSCARSRSRSDPDLRLAFLAGDEATDRARRGTARARHPLGQPPAAANGRGAARRPRGRSAACARPSGPTPNGDARCSTRSPTRGVAAFGRSGMNVWVPVPDEDSAAAALLEAGFAVSTGARYRIRSAPALRITTATLARRGRGARRRRGRARAASRAPQPVGLEQHAAIDRRRGPGHAQRVVGADLDAQLPARHVHVDAAIDQAEPVRRRGDRAARRAGRRVSPAPRSQTSTSIAERERTRASCTFVRFGNIA